MRPRRLFSAQLLVLAAVAAAPARADDPADAPPAGAEETAAAPSAPPASAADLRKDTWRAAGITVGALVLDGVVTSTWKTTACKICGSNQLDEKARTALRWSDTAAASRASDLLAKAVIPALAGADALRSTRSWGNAGRDVLVVAEAASIANLATDVAKIGFARRRPGAPETGGGSAAYHSLWSFHSSLAFSVATAQAMQDTIRGDEAAPWAWVIGLTLATAVGYLRVAGDAHWLTDVLAGGAVGTAVGVAVPLLETRLVHGVRIVPAPGGIAVLF